MVIVCFEDTRNFGTWKLFTWKRPKFGHVYVVQYDPSTDVWIKLECASERLKVDVYRGEDANPLINHIQNNCICLDVKPAICRTQLPRWLYCVTMVKHFVGVKNPFIFTPYQLYCELIKRGSQRIFEPYRS